LRFDRELLSRLRDDSRIPVFFVNFRRALEMAQRQGSKAWALRAATDLARLRQSQGRAEEALSVLKPLYEDYQEGFDTLDLVRARETREALGR